MNLLCFFAPVLLSCLPFFHSTTDNNTICPESFSCPNLASFNYPFYNATEKRCGLIKVNCTPNGGKIQFGGHSYEVCAKFGPDYSTLMIRNRTFERLVNDSSCEALIDNFTSPSPLLYSISFLPFITLYKCTKNPSYDEKVEAYFHQPNINSYKKCENHNFYYKYLISDTTVVSDLPPTCEVIWLPVKLREPGNLEAPDITDIFSLLGSVLSFTFKLSNSCDECHKEDGQCHTPNGKFRCLNAKKETHDAHRKLIPIAGILGLCIGFVIILIMIILCFIMKLKWTRRTKICVDVENFLKNHEFLAKRYSYLQVKKMTNSFKIKLGQGGFGSVYRGVLNNGNLVAVKILSELKGNGEDFINEVASVGRTSHVNIVSLVGFCFEGHQRALIYEFMPNGSLEKLIYDQGFSNNTQIGWGKLHEISIGIARGLEYLHIGCNTRILHFNIFPLRYLTLALPSYFPRK